MVDAISRTSSSTDINYSGAITPDALLLYCQSKLNDLDNQMQAQFQKQKQYRAGTAAVNDLISIFNEPANTAKGIDGRCIGNGGVDPKTYEDRIDAAFARALDSLPPGPERTQIEEAQKKWKAGFHDRTGQGPDDGGWEFVFTAGECKALADSLTNVSKSLSSSAELDMINLNSLMSQRQTAIQMCTGMVNSLGEGPKAIAAKF